MKVERTGALAWREVGDEVVVIHLVRHRIFGLSGSGAEIWKALEQPRTVEELCELVGRADEPAEDALEGLLSFLAELVEEGLASCDGIMPSPARSSGSTGPEVPRIGWSEDVRQFAGQCDFQPGMSVLCDQNPGGS